MAVKEKHSHYYKNVGHLTTIDIYRVLERFNVTDPTIQHAVKKLLVAGGRGAGKDQDQDVQEAIDSLTRFQEMRVENAKETQPHNQLVTIVHAPQLHGGSDGDASAEAIRRFIESDPVAFRKAIGDGPRVKAKKMPEPVKRDLARRKATKRAAKPAPRRGR